MRIVTAQPLAIRLSLLVLSLLMAFLPRFAASAADPSRDASGAPGAAPTEGAVAAGADDTQTPGTTAEPAPAEQAPVDEASESTGGDEASATDTDDTSTGTGEAVTAEGGEATTESGPYDPNVDGSPSGNGNGGGGDSKPCAGCVGSADDKNPPGQLPDGETDGDNGYECDANSGAGRTNPAHSGCRAVAEEAPSIHLEKTGPTEAAIGDEVAYTFEVTNTGDVPLSNVFISDPMLGDAIEVTPDTLPVQGAVTVIGRASADYTVVEADVVDGEVTNVATALGTSPLGEDVSDDDDHVLAVVTVPPGDEPAIALVKDGPPAAAIGDTITYTFDVENTGEVTLLDVHVTDPLLGGEEIAVDPPILAPGEHGTAEAEYTVDQADIVDQTVPNTATAHGTPPAGPDVSAEDDHIVDVPLIPEVPEPAIDLAKDGPASAVVGERITYTFTVTNTGKTTLTNVHITDPLLGGRLAVTPSTLGRGDVGTATATYRVKRVDIREGQVLNTAVAHGTPPDGGEVSEDDDHVIDVPNVPEAPEPDLTLEKSGPATADVGDRITYRFKVTNTGDVTLTDVSITDPKLGLTQLAVTPSTLQPGASGTAHATYVVTAADGRRGQVHNTAIAMGTPPEGDPVTDADDHTTGIGGPPPPPPPLPATGANTAAELLVAALAFALGGALLLLTRTRRPAAVAPSLVTYRLAGYETPPPVHRRPAASTPGHSRPQWLSHPMRRVTSSD